MKTVLKAMMLGGLATLGAMNLFAQRDITGDWKGTLKGGPAELRLALHIVKADNGDFKATLDSIDQGANGIPVNAVTLEGSALKLSVEAVNGSYEGKVSPDRNSIAGTWSQGQSLPLDFERGTFKTTEHKPGKPSDIDGAWSGTLDTGNGTLRVVFHIVNTEDGLTATMDSPDQGGKGIPVTSVTRNGSAIRMEMKPLTAEFEGKIAAAPGSMTGTFTQAGHSIPLVLTRTRE